MKINFTIDTANDVFQDWGMIEVQRIVEEAARKIVDSKEKYEVKLYDGNGNNIGKMAVTP